MIRSTLGDLYLKYFKGDNRLERIWKIAQVDFKKRYYNDKFGLLWALINPLTQIALYYFVFTRILNRSQDNFVLFLFSGIIIWFAFSNATIMAVRLLYEKLYLINNIQFNWLDLYSSHIISTSIGLTFNLLAYMVALVILGTSLGSYIYLFPIVLLSWGLTTYAACILISIIRPIFEDINHIWSILLMVGLWVSGVFFDGSFYLENYTWFSYVNPFVGILINTRACLLEGNIISYGLLWYDLIFSLLLFGFSIWLFNQYAPKFIEKM